LEELEGQPFPTRHDTHSAIECGKKIPLPRAR
jgi:hypothetical protein